MAKERNQNPTVGDTINLRMVTMNSNMPRDVTSIDSLEIYRLDPLTCSDTNTDGRILVQTVDTSSIVQESTGQYLLALTTSSPQYVIGKYLDVWEVIFEPGDSPALIENCFELYPDLWYTSTTPAVYGFNFRFQPNRIRKGSIKWLAIKIEPNVPRATDLERYYTNLAIAGTLKISIEQNCGPCPPLDDGNSIIVEDEVVEVRDKVFGYYKLDTTENGLDLDCGIYNIWFELSYGGSIDVSPKSQFLIY